MRSLLAATLLLAACADDISARDYSIGECPSSPTQGQSVEVCDRGVGQSPRYVSIEECAVELGLTVPSRGPTLTVGHPARERCVAAGGAALNTIDGVRSDLVRYP